MRPTTSGLPSGAAACCNVPGKPSNSTNAQAPDSQAYTVLRLATDHTDENSVELALRTQTLTGHVLRPDAFRKQLSRARRHFAQYIVDAISPTLVQPNSQQVIDELAELGLTTYVRDFLPELFRDTAK